VCRVRGAFIGTGGLTRDVTMRGVNTRLSLESIHVDKKLKTMLRSPRWVGSGGG
jgi:hypothetical protein